ncbi:MAG: hypothetical protein ACC707_05145 [Thiohalomonadales bacterium]
MQFGSRGWQHRNWLGSFYPEDLPPEWRLPYYSNEFETVLIPSSELRASHPDQIQEWLEDCSDNFSFFIEIDAKQEFSMQLQKAQLLIPQLGGIVLDIPVKETGYTSENIGQLVHNTLGHRVQVYAPESTSHEKIERLGAKLFKHFLTTPKPAGACLALLSDNKPSMTALKELLAVLQATGGGCEALFLAGSNPEVEVLRQASDIYNLSY